MKHLIFIVLFCLAVNPVLSGQKILSGFEFDLGRTKMELAPKSYFSWRLGFNFSSPGAIYGIDFFHTRQPNKIELIPQFRLYKGKNKVTTISLMYGRRIFSPGNLDISLSSGISFLGGAYEISEPIATNPPFYEANEVKFTTIGLPLKLHMRYQIIDGFGLGFSLFGNINSKNKYWGREAAIYIGGVFSEE